MLQKILLFLRYKEKNNGFMYNTRGYFSLAPFIGQFVFPVGGEERGRMRSFVILATKSFP